MKKSIYILILFFLLLFPSTSWALVKPTSNFYINDYANILSSETENYILQRSLALNEVDGTQIVVVTIQTLNGMSIEEYANKLYNSFGIGDREKNNGLLLLLALEEREFRVEVGDGLGDILPDGKTGRFQDEYIIPYLKENDWDNGIKNGYDAFYAEIVEKNNLSVNYNKPVNTYSNANSISIYLLPIALTLAIIIGTIIKNSKNIEKSVGIILIIWTILLSLAKLYATELIFLLIIFLVFFVLTIFGVGHIGINTYNNSGRHSSSRGSSSNFSGGFSGGGGRSSGGGSSRKF